MRSSFICDVIFTPKVYYAIRAKKCLNNVFENLKGGILIQSCQQPEYQDVSTLYAIKEIVSVQCESVNRCITGLRKPTRKQVSAGRRSSGG